MENEDDPASIAQDDVIGQVDAVIRVKSFKSGAHEALTAELAVIGYVEPVLRVVPLPPPAFIAKEDVIAQLAVIGYVDPVLRVVPPPELPLGGNNA